MSKKYKFQWDADEVHYYLFKNITVSKNEKYTVYICTKYCSNINYYLEGYKAKDWFSFSPSHFPYLSINEKMCYHNCLSSSDYKFTYDKNYVFKWNVSKPYYYKRNKECLDKCISKDYAYSITIYNNIYECTDNCNLLLGYYID